MDLDLPPPRPVHIRFCGRPAIATGVVNLQILFGELNYYLVQRVEGKSIELGNTAGIEPIPQRAVSDNDSRSSFVLCSQEGLPTGSFHVEEGGDYWIANGTEHRAGITQSTISETISVGSAKMQKRDSEPEGESCYHPEKDAALDCVESEKASRKRHKNEKRLATLEPNPIASKELESGEPPHVAPHVHSHSKKHSKKKSKGHNPDSHAHDDAKADLVNSSEALEEPLCAKFVPILLQEQDERNNPMQESTPPLSHPAASIPETPQVVEDRIHAIASHGVDEPSLGERARRNKKGKSAEASEVCKNTLDKEIIRSNNVSDFNACVQSDEVQSTDRHPLQTPRYKPSGGASSTEGLKDSILAFEEDKKHLTSPSLPSPVRRNMPKASEPSLPSGRPSPPAESPMLGLSQMPTTIVEEFSLDASADSSYAGSEYLYDE
ncbi:unnamed protein product [Phytomonas sp. EM1]|nr:unnamed protein product [Phytomonas sp. EM1]|eukprot:CCW64453.1 unnamed protein product [Phytomonas sp. isolate EM1]